MNPQPYYKNGEDLTFTLRSKAEETVLFQKAKAGDAAAKEQIIKDHLLLVATIARRIARGQLPEDDVISAANFALMKAYENFTPELNNRFSGFVKLYVRGEIARLWKDRNIVDKGNFDDGEAIVSVPLNEEMSEESTSEERDHHSFLLKLLRESTDILDAREKSILSLIYSETPLTQAEVARQMKITRERVRQIHDAAIAKVGRELRRRMNENGVNQ